MLWHKQGHLGAPRWPKAAKVKAVHPHLTLEGERDRERQNHQHGMYGQPRRAWEPAVQDPAVVGQEMPPWRWAARQAQAGLGSSICRDDWEGGRNNKSSPQIPAPSGEQVLGPPDCLQQPQRPVLEEREAVTRFPPALLAPGPAFMALRTATP